MADEGVIAILDVDGTLVDTNYHHALAWSRALRAHGKTVPLVDLHRHMGMGGDQLVGEVAGEEFDREHGEDARAREKEEYGKLIDEVAALEARRSWCGRWRTAARPSSSRPRPR